MLPASFTPKILYFDTVDSTNIKMKQLVNTGLSEGGVVVAREQTKGRGRGNHQWYSPGGGLYLSCYLLPNDPKRVTDLSILAGVAMAQASRQILPKAIQVSVKWPNDCLINFKKAGGVLCEALGEKYGFGVIVGLGLNINTEERELAPFKERPFGATSFHIEMQGGKLDLEECEKILIHKLFTLYHTYQTQGFTPIQYLWEKNCGLLGKQIELRETGWQPGDGDKLGMTRGTFLGIDESGALVLTNAKGERRQYLNGEITCYWL
jgi:BirA family biotin operon repressor/biotin-[acetyl-CoA-carboxylase] ligase